MRIGRVSFLGKGVIVIFVFEQEKQKRPYFCDSRATQDTQRAPQANRVLK
jgi:hypothetical protein